MKLLNYTTSYFALILLIVISLWAGIFYYAMLHEIYDSIDDGLDNQKGLIIRRAATDTALLSQNAFDEGSYAIRPLAAKQATAFHDVYMDTMMYMQNEKDYEPVRLLKTVFQQNGNYYQLQIATSMVEEDDLSAALFYSLLWLYLGLVATIVVLNNFLLKRTWQPFYRLLRQLRNFRLEEPVPVMSERTKIDEFRLLNATLKDVLQSNVDSYNVQKQFIENAAHELQTPLAISISRLEALAERANLPEADAPLVSSALENLERLTRLNRSLLLLSRIGNRQYPGADNININELTRKIVSEFGDLATHNQIKISVQDKGACIIMMNADLAVIMLINLVKNALVHNEAGGFVVITIDKDSFEVENSGGRNPLDEEKIFSRFYRAHPSEASTGLGLSIVKAIAALYQFELTYFFQQTHRFTLKFPIQPK